MTRRKKTPAMDAEKKSNVVALVTVGASRRMAARYIGCSHSTIIRNAEADADFAARLEKATCDAELGLLQLVRKAARQTQNWRAAAWILERTRPERYARRSPDVVTAPQIAQILSRFARIVAEEVPVARYRKRVLAQLAELYRSVAGRSPRWGRTAVVRKKLEAGDAP